MNAGKLIVSMIISGIVGKALYAAGKSIARSAGAYPSKEVEKKIDALRPKLNVMTEFYKDKKNSKKLAELEDLDDRLTSAITEEDYLKVEVDVEKFWDTYKKEQKS